MSRIFKFKIECDIIAMINQLIVEEESAMREYLEEYDNSEDAGKSEAKAECLKQLRDNLLEKMNPSLSDILSGKVIVEP